MVSQIEWLLSIGGKQMSKWIYKGKPLTEIPSEKSYGFIYEITTKCGLKYIGQKRFRSIRNVKISKKRSDELYSGRGRRPTKEKKITESNWKKYKSSNKVIKKMKEKDLSYKIICIVDSLNMLNVMETYYIITEGALFKETYLNGWAKFTLNKELNKNYKDYV